MLKRWGRVSIMTIIRRWISPLEMSPDRKKNPEMNELETDKIALKI